MKPSELFEGKNSSLYKTFMNQNQYGKLQLCIRCQKPLEKARTMNVGKGVCNVCKKKHASEYIKNKKIKNNEDKN